MGTLHNVAMLYRAHFFSHAGDRFGSEQFRAADDQQAIEHARRNLRSPWGKGHEIWQDNRIVHREIYE
jgi:hypothetical protein